MSAIKVGANYSFSAIVNFSVEPAGLSARRWEIRHAGYGYRLADDREREILAFQWDPDGIGEGTVRTPHVHVGHGRVGVIRPKDPNDLVGDVLSRLVRAHVPTGAVGFAAVLRMLVDDFEAPVRRPDWDIVLTECAQQEQAIVFR